METIGSWLTTAIETVNGWVWSSALVGLCLLAGLYFSLRTRFVQVRRFREMVRLLFGSTKKDGKKVGISSFQAFAMALSGRVGTGNIVGVATAIGFGGPGAIVWMWIIAFFGAGSAFVEATLAQIYKENHNGQFRGGPAYYIEKGLRSQFLGSMFAVLAALACGVFLPPVQCNGIALSCSRSFGVDVWVIGLIVATLIGLVIIGGVKRIANVAQIVAPVMAVVYIILSIVALAVHWQLVPDSTKEILGYQCQMATTRFKGRQWTVWYTEDIPLDEGPWKLRGLPGLVLSAYDAKRQYVFEGAGLEQVSTDQPVVIVEEKREKISQKNFRKVLSRYDPMAALSSRGIKIISVKEADGSEGKLPTKLPSNSIELE